MVTLENTAFDAAADASVNIPDIQSIWDYFYQSLSKKIRVQFIKAFFHDLSLVKVEDKGFTLISKDARITSHLKNRYLDVMNECASEIMGRKITVSVQTEMEVSSSGSPAGQQTNQLYAKSVRNSDHSQIQVNPHYTFDRFVKGASNAQAFTACWEAAHKPQAYHNPLYLYGGVGLGKTHLLMAMGNLISNMYPWLKVKYIPSGKFQGDLIESVQKKSVNQFRSIYRDVDVFLLDDIQLVSSKSEFTQDELFNTFNYLYQNQKQIVISSDRPAQRLLALKDRLISRFQSGLIVDIKSPDFATRVGIIKKKSQEMKLTLNDDIVEYLAKSITSQVRLIEAVLIKLDFLSRWQTQGQIQEQINRQNNLVSLDMAKESLDHIPVDESQSQIKIENIMRVVAENFQVTSGAIKGASQSGDICLARHTGMYLAHNLFPELPLSYIASVFGRSDHTTVMHGVKKIRKIVERDASFQRQIEKIQSLF